MQKDAITKKEASSLFFCLISNMRPFLIPFIFTLILCNRAVGQKPASAVEPSWITRTTADSHPDAKLLNDSKDGYINLVLERQVNLADGTTYRRTVLRMVTEAGIQNASKVSVEYDPTYQRLLWHKINIIRDGRVINKLNLSRIKILRQEAELDRSIYNGTVTAMLILEDVRKGDLIDYAYSVQGFNPIFSDKYSTSLQVQFPVPVGQILYRIICPSARKLNIKPRPIPVGLKLMKQGANEVYQWEFTNIPALREQDDLPSWYDPYASIEVSEFATWSEVSKWALPLFARGHPLSDGLKKEIAHIEAAAGGDEEKKVVAALRFVQDEVRYMGIEMGVNSHKPNDPDKIFRQRFGDCKDKSFLLCTMLQAMHIDAAPVLINTTEKQELKTRLPSPVAFDHCTVRVRLGGKTWWLDPTISFQRGGLADIAYPDFKCGLVLTDTTTGLTDIPLQEPGRVAAKEKFLLQDMSGAAKLEVVTTYSGGFADEIRDQLNNNSLSDMQQEYLTFYNNYYEGMKVADSLRVEDNDTTGKITTYEYYTIDRIWEQGSGAKKASFEALLIHGILEKPRERERTMPMQLTYPARYREEIEIRVPEDWDFDRSSKSIRSPAFSYTSTISATDRVVNIVYDYETLKDHVTPAEAADYFDDYEKLRGDLGYVLTYGKRDSAPRGGGDGSKGLGGLSDRTKLWLCLILIGVIIYFVRRR
jgi:transglutaminase-like putative cysteine protease